MAQKHESIRDEDIETRFGRLAPSVGGDADEDDADADSDQDDPEDAA